jgi:hypothetical protein
MLLNATFIKTDMKYLLIIIATYLLNVVMCWITGNMGFVESMFSVEVLWVMIVIGWIPVFMYNILKNVKTN